MSIRTIPLVVAASAAMVLAAPAVAKEIEEAAVCGAGGCTKVAPRGDAHAMLEGGAVSDAPASAPFYRIRLGIGDGSGKVFERFSILYVPSAGQGARDRRPVDEHDHGDRARTGPRHARP